MTNYELVSPTAYSADLVNLLASDYPHIDTSFLSRDTPETERLITELTQLYNWIQNPPLRNYGVEPSEAMLRELVSAGPNYPFTDQLIRLQHAIAGVNPDSFPPFTGSDGNTYVQYSCSPNGNPFKIGYTEVIDPNRRIISRSFISLLDFTITK